MHISDFQKQIKDTYYERDCKRGKEATFLWLVEEVGELAKALRREDKKNIDEELADVIAWTMSLGNVLNIDIEEILKTKYGETCFYCNFKPCRCIKK